MSIMLSFIQNHTWHSLLKLQEDVIYGFLLPLVVFKKMHNDFIAAMCNLDHVFYRKTVNNKLECY